MVDPAGSAWAAVIAVNLIFMEKRIVKCRDISYNNCRKY